MKVAIAGYGLEGESNYNYWSIDENNDITIVDQKKPTRDLPSDAKIIIGDNVMENLDGFDLVVRTAGLAPHKIKTDGKIWSATNEFFEKCPAPIIGVTGTKGKGTTASLISSILEHSGRNVWLIGNIGKPSLDVLCDIQQSDIVVYELSSFQLWDLEYSPHVAVVLLIEPEHLDVHPDFNNYLNAKANIRRFQKANDICVYHPTNTHSCIVAKSSEVGQMIRFGIPDDGGVYVKNRGFYQDEHEICSIDDLQLIGQHNIENACAAISTVKIFGLSDESIKSGLRKFKGLPHRIEFVRELNGVKYYNDSFSSSTPATIAAIKSFSQPEIVIVGGIDRGGNFTEIANIMKEQNNIKQVIVIGDIREKLGALIKNINPDFNIDISNFKTMKEIVMLAKHYAKSGDVVLLSPGCASFDMFKDFSDRGNQFKDEVNKL